MDTVPEVTTDPKRTVLDYDDIVGMAPFFKGKRRLVSAIMKLLDYLKTSTLSCGLTTSIFLIICLRGRSSPSATIRLARLTASPL